MKFDRIVEFVGRVRKMAGRAGCRKCGKTRTRLALRGQPTLSAMYRSGATVAKIKKAIVDRGWFCRQCANKIDGSTAAATIREQFPPGDEGTQQWEASLMRNNVPDGYRYDEDLHTFLPLEWDGEPNEALKEAAANYLKMKA